VLAAVEYLQGIGRDHIAHYAGATGGLSGRRQELRAAMLAIRDHERDLSRHFLWAIHAVPGLRLFGIADPERVAERVPTFAITIQGHTPQALSTTLAARGFATWAGHYYALSLVERLGQLDGGGMLRIGAAHYNTIEELDDLVAALVKETA
jgi:selenocysteine lyase/cysteine desulfurase